VKNVINTIGRRGGVEKTAEKGGSRRLEAYIGGLSIQFPNIGAVMSDEESRSSLASTAAGIG
jgi:hypothetical protein